MILARSPSLLFTAVLALLAIAHRPAQAQKVAVPGFRIDLIARAPEIEHPSTLVCDDAGNLFVGEDPMDMRGPPTNEIDRIVLLQFDERGKVRRKTVFADKLSAVFGMIWNDGALYVMHAPHYTVLRDTDGDGVADVRKRLADGFGPPPGKYGFNDHIVSGIQLGMDGRVYVSVGDKGIPKAVGADGSRITMEGGGVARMKLDGTQLEVFSRGTRNHLDAALDASDNVFTYDNTDDGLGWWTRFTRHFEGGYYGYPFDYLKKDRAERYLPAISEHGSGAPAGGACYLEAIWPDRFRGAAFFCEWGKRKVQAFHPRPAGGGFTATVEDFVVHDDGDEEFRPIDLCFSPDGRHMYLADWNFAGWRRPNRVGRLFRVTALVNPARDADAGLRSRSFTTRRQEQRRLAAQGVEGIRQAARTLQSPSVPSRARIHAIWALEAAAEGVAGFDPGPHWLRALTDTDPDVRAQSARALGLRRHRGAVEALSNLLGDDHAAVRLQAAIALGRIEQNAAPAALIDSLVDKDRHVRFAVFAALRSIGDWQSLKTPLLGKGEAPALSALSVLRGAYDARAVALLAQAVDDSPSAPVRAQSIAALAEVFRQAPPYVDGWWGSRPAAGEPPRARTLRWGQTDTIAATLRKGLRSPHAEVRVAAARAQASIGDDSALPIARRLVAHDPDVAVRRAVMRVLADARDSGSLEPLAALAGDGDAPSSLRAEAVRTIQAIGRPRAAREIARLLKLTDPPDVVLSAVLRAAAELRPGGSSADLKARLAHPIAGVRAAAAQAYARVSRSPQSTIRGLLKDASPEVRGAALLALAGVNDRQSIPTILAAYNEDQTRTFALGALTKMPDRRALGPLLDGLDDSDPDVRAACAAALAHLRESIRDDIKKLARTNKLGNAARRSLSELYAGPAILRRWRLVGAWSKLAPRPNVRPIGAPRVTVPVIVAGESFYWRSILTNDADGKVEPDRYSTIKEDCWSVAYAALESDRDRSVRWRLRSDDQAMLWLNNQLVHSFEGDRGWDQEEDVGNVKLVEGLNHLWLISGNSGGSWQFRVALGDKDESMALLNAIPPPKHTLAEYRQFATQQRGDAKRGERLFFDRQGAGCAKCHQVGKRGTSIAGPNLTGIAARYSRQELIRSVLEPSSRIASGFELSNIVTTEGRQIQGIVKSRTAGFVELLGADNRTTRIAAAKIDEINRSPLSAMPSGMEKGLELRDFADLVAYLESLK